MKSVKLIFLALAVMFAISLLLAPIYGVESAVVAADEVESAINATEETENEDSIDISIWWETAKDWVIEHLSTVVGAVMAIATFSIGVATKFSFVPKILAAFKSLFASIGEWYEKNGKQLEDFRGIMEGFTANAGKIIEDVKNQSAENSELRKELVNVRKEYISLQNKNNALERALFSSTLILADQFEDLIQASGLTKAEADRHYEQYTNKKKLIAEALTATGIKVVESVTEDV